MSVSVRNYKGMKKVYEVDITVLFPNGTRHRERRKSPVSSKSASQRWGEDRARELLLSGPPQQKKEVPTLEEFSKVFMEGHAIANRHKPSGIAAKETIFRVHLIPALGSKRLDEITSKDVQELKAKLNSKARKTVNNILTVLNTTLRTAVEWDVIDGMPCKVKLIWQPTK